MIALLSLEIPDAILYGSFTLVVTTMVTIIWSMVKLWFAFYENKRKLDEHMRVVNIEIKETKEEREKDRDVFTQLKSEVSALNGSLQTLINMR